MSENQVYTIDEAAARLRVSRATLYKMIKRGELRTLRIGGRQKISEREIERLIDRKEAAS